jgi:cytochrome c oxidase cbb3-type subunit 4
MTYTTISAVSQVAALVFFMAMFFGVLIYAFWPSNRKMFERAAQLPLSEVDGDDERRPL